jgi:RNA-directed DNA polymerase
MLARAILAGEPTVEGIAARCARTLGRPWRWLRSLARRYVEEFAGKVRPRRREVVAFLVQDEGFARNAHAGKLRVVDWLDEPQQMQAVEAAEGWKVPAIESVGALAAWLGVESSEMEWFADLKDLNRRGVDGRLCHYHYRVLAKASGGVRLIEAPKGRLKQMQRLILAGILEHVPVHDAVHGFVKGKSIKSFAQLHVGRQVVLRMDLQDFFPKFRAARVAAFFRTMGYPEMVAERLAGMCTNAVAASAWARRGAEVDWETRQMYRRAHLPQGAPTSPALANGMAYRLDCRLSGLASAAGGVYTRYADDLAFSGDGEFARGVGRFAVHAMAVAMEEGLEVHGRKTRVMRQGGRQKLAGLVVNAHPNFPRDEFDRLKAVLTNCVRHGAASQNREGHAAFREHLLGQVGFVEMVNALRGAKLRGIYERIVW